MSDIKHMVLRSYDPYMTELYGKPKSKTDKVINLRSYLSHSILQQSVRYGGISSHCTMRHGMDGFGFQMIDFDKHPERWKNVYIPVTEEQEAKILAKACLMADVPMDCFMRHVTVEPSQYISEEYTHNKCYYSQNHVKYDKLGVALAFLTRARIYTGHKDDMWCSEALCHLLLEVWPDLLEFGESAWTIFDITLGVDDAPVTSKKLPTTILQPDDIHPSLLDSICRTKFDKIAIQ